MTAEWKVYHWDRCLLLLKKNYIRRRNNINHHQILKQSTIQNPFGPEYSWMKSHSWWMAENNQANMLLLLDADKMSLHHLNIVRNWMREEQAAIQTKLEDEQKKVRSTSLTGGHRI